MSKKNLRGASLLAISAACALSFCWLGGVAIGQDQPKPTGPVITKTLIVNPDGSTTQVDGDATHIKAAQAGPATKPAPTDAPTQAATTMPAGEAFHVGRTATKVAPDAQRELDEVKKAYSNLTALDLSGSVSGKFDVDGKQNNPSLAFASAWQSPDKFRMEVKDDMTVGATGQKVYAIKLDANEYLLLDQPKDKITLENLPGPIAGLVAAKNPALVMVLSQDPVELLMAGITDVKKMDDVKIGDKSYSVLSLTGPDHDETLTIDPQTHLLRRIELDHRKEIEKSGQTNVKSATIAFDYVSTTPSPATQPGAKDAFAWSAPAGAKDVTQTVMAQEEEFPAMALAGKPAPDFKLPALDGKEISLAALKGKVVVVDFWATWCGPCQASMPHLNQIYKDNKDSDFTLIGVSVDEDKSKVPAFAKEMGLLFPIVIDDEKAGVADKFSVDHYPTTFVIGKNGVVRKVLVGNSPKNADALEKEVAAALQARENPSGMMHPVVPARAPATQPEPAR